MNFPVPKRVIWISTDHMRYDCIGAHGNSVMHTPNLDRIVREGLSFDRCYAQNPLCMPSRASFMTGLYPQQTGVVDNGQDLPADFPYTVARVFKAGGYVTAHIGKLHFQSHEDNDLDPRSRHDYGFDIFWQAEEPGSYEDAYVTWLRTEYPEYVDMFRVPRSSSPSRDTEIDGKVLDAPWQASFSGWVAEQAVRCLKAGNRSEKLFIHLGFYAPHPPLNPTWEMFAPYKDLRIAIPDYPENEASDKPDILARMLLDRRGWEKSRFVEYRRHFYAMVTGVDMAIGHIIEFLDTKGMLDDTLIVFSSDHGDMCGNHRMLLKQHSFYEELMRLPLLLYWPAAFGRSGKRISGFVEMVDVLPTLLGLSGVTVPGIMAGKNYSQALKEGYEPDGKLDVYAFHGPGHMMLRTSTHKLIRYANGDEVLYDLEKDPMETKNIIGLPGSELLLRALKDRLFERTIDATRSIIPRRYRF